MNDRSLLKYVEDTVPGIIVLVVSFFVALFFGHSQTSAGQAAVNVTLRFLRIVLVLCIPLYLLFSVYSRIVEWKKGTFLRVEQDRPLAVRPLKHWLFRPFQGIGIGFLFRSKLLAMLQLIAGPSVPTSLVLPRGGVGMRHFLVTAAITATVSLLLSVLWTLDDMGIRYFNKRDRELKMIGKYVGTVMPLVFGLYGVLGLMANYSAFEAFLSTLRAVFVLYPPFVFFAVFHAGFVRRRKAFADKRDLLTPGGVWSDRP